jgi:uncharacterized protein (DUF58 family)
MLETKEILKKVRKIEIKTKHLVDGLLQGAYHSVFKGQGIEYSDVREYAPGDDIRSIDWNVTARMNEPYVKEFIEERDLTVYIVLDLSASNEFGDIKSKKETGVEIAASLMFAALRNNDRIGLCLFTSEVELYIPPRKGRRHILKLIRDIIQYQPKNKTTDLKESLIFLSHVIKKRSVIFIISDFFTEVKFEKQLKILRKRHDIIAVNVNDMREHDMPDIGYIELEDEETGEQVLVDTSNEEFRKKYAQLIHEKNSELKNKLKKLKTDLIELKTGEPFEIPLRKFFRLRERRMVR